MSKLKPCPFCGGEAEIYVEYDGDGALKYHAYCENCAAGSRKIMVHPSSRDHIGEVVEAWNRRAEPERTCDNCKFKSDCTQSVIRRSAYIDGVAANNWAEAIDYCSAWARKEESE